ncbi:MAG: hypothetical protein IPM99_27830 [Rubrivivax sp.]|nr:hypothetical protein [Rubrivivax sp.]
MGPRHHELWHDDIKAGKIRPPLDRDTTGADGSQAGLRADRARRHDDETNRSCITALGAVLLRYRH